MDIQLFATDEELQDFPENKTDSTVPDKTSNSNSINLTASDLPRSHTDLPKISFRLPERKSKRKSRRDHRRKSRSNTKNSIADQQVALAKNPMHRQADTHPTVDRQVAPAKNRIAHRQSVQLNDQLGDRQEIWRIGKPIHPAYLDQLVGPSEAVLARQPTLRLPILGSPETAPPLAHQPALRQPILRPPVPRQVPPLLSLRLQPDLNALARTLSPQALRYVHLGIQISQNLLN